MISDPPEQTSPTTPSCDVCPKLISVPLIFSNPLQFDRVSRFYLFTPGFFPHSPLFFFQLPGKGISAFDGPIMPFILFFIFMPPPPCFACPRWFVQTFSQIGKPLLPPGYLSVTTDFSRLPSSNTIPHAAPSFFFATLALRSIRPHSLPRVGHEFFHYLPQRSKWSLCWSTPPPADPLRGQNFAPSRVPPPVFFYTINLFSGFGFCLSAFQHFLFFQTKRAFSAGFVFYPLGAFPSLQLFCSSVIFFF